jgi:GNAT superfamily N-acetyltransferase
MSVLRPRRAHKPSRLRSRPTVLRLVIGTGGFTGEAALAEPYSEMLPLKQRRPLLLFTDFYVHPLRRGLGWGTRLLRAVVRWADRRGWDLVTYASAYGVRSLPNELLTSWYCHVFDFRPARADPRFLVRRCR